MTRKRKRGKRARPISVAVGVLLLLAGVHLGAFDALENRWQDLLHVWRGMRPGDPRVVFVAIDDRSIEEIGQFPWPRRVYAPLIDALKRDGARVIGFDVAFLEPSRPEDDRALVAATRRAGNVIHAIDLNDKDINRQLSHFSFHAPFGALRAAAKGLGLVYAGFCFDDDGAVRSLPLLVGSRRQGASCRSFAAPGLLEDPGRVPSLGVAMLSAYEGLAPEQYVRRHGAVLRLNYAGERSWQEPHPSGARLNGRLLTVERRAFAFPRLSAIDVIKDRLKPEERARLSGAIALVGWSASGAGDKFHTPFSGITPGAEVHANVMDNLLQGRALRLPPAWLEMLCALVLTLSALLLIRLNPLLGSLAAGGVLAAWCALGYALFARNLLLPAVSPLLGFSTCFLLLLIERLRHEHREKRWVRSTFAQYLSPKVIDTLAADPSRLRLGGEGRDVSVFFLDIAGFTSIAEGMDPEALTHFLNGYLTALTRVILRNDGVVDKYIGDCIMAFWNAPMDQPRHRELACLSALECVRAVEGMNAELRQEGIREGMYIRVGVNSGHAVVGNLGSEMRFSYTVIGDAVNVASRLESANKFFGSHIMVSEESLKDCRDKFEARELGRIRVVGKDKPVRVFELLARQGELTGKKAEALATYNRALELYRARDWAAAHKQFEGCLELLPNDRTAELYLKECEKLRAAAPGAHWDGAFNLTSK